jgi:hypothetical protein
MILDREQQEAEIGIGNGQICYVDENYCRHCIEKEILSSIYLPTFTTTLTDIR